PPRPRIAAQPRLVAADSMSTLFSLRGRTAVLTGAAGHLGAAMARGLAAAGAKVYLLGRSPTPLEALEREIGSQGHVAVVDVTDTDAVAGFLRGLTEKQLDVLVNNAYAGAAPSEDAFAKAYEITVTAAFRMVRESLPLLRAAVQAQGGASV